MRATRARVWRAVLLSLLPALSLGLAVAGRSGTGGDGPPTAAIRAGTRSRPAPTPAPRAGASAAARGPHRGVSYWASPDGRDALIVHAPPDGRLVALDARTGGLRKDFGEGGLVDRRAGVADGWPHAPFEVSSPPAIYRGLAITGSHLQEYPALGPAGDVRAYDVRTGALAWRFHTVARPGEPGHESWEDESWRDRSGVNVWSVMRGDVERGLVFLPIGSPSYDFYGGDRKGPGLFANALVALDAATGAMRWHFQTVHH